MKNKQTEYTIVKMPGLAKYAIGDVYTQKHKESGKVSYAIVGDGCYSWHAGFVSSPSKDHVPERQVDYIEAKAQSSSSLKKTFALAAVVFGAVAASKVFGLPLDVTCVTIVIPSFFGVMIGTEAVKSTIKAQKHKSKLLDDCSGISVQNVRHAIRLKDYAAKKADCTCMRTFLKQAAAVAVAFPISKVVFAGLCIYGATNLYAKCFKGYRNIRKAKDHIIVAGCASDLKKMEKMDLRPFGGVLEDKADKVSAHHARTKKFLGPKMLAC